MKKIAVVIPLAAVLAGCGSSPLIPDKTVTVSSSFHPALEAVVGVAIVGVVAYYVIDPLAPNWEVKVDQLDPTRVAISLRKKRFSTGGDGEALGVFRRKAQEIVDDNGFAGYSILQFTEGVDSETTFARRVVHGVIAVQLPAG
ncbi:MAG: hypothetical protein ABI794_01490 [Betaproteobacteria bacterium]